VRSPPLYREVGWNGETTTPRSSTIRSLTILHNSLSGQIPSVFSEKLALPCLIHCELFWLRCHGHSLLFSSYLRRIKQKEILLEAPVDTLCRIWLTSSWIVLHPSLYDVPSLALLLPFLTSGPDLGMWFDCWVSVEFLHALILRKGSGSTTPITASLETDRKASSIYFHNKIWASVWKVKQTPWIFSNQLCQFWFFIKWRWKIWFSILFSFCATEEDIPST